MLQRLLLVALLAAGLIPLAGCGLFHRNCNDRPSESNCR
jgi:hypothetical protein